MVFALLATLFSSAPAQAAPPAPGFQTVNLGLIADNDFAVFMGDDKNATRLFWQNNVDWGVQVSAMSSLDVVPRAGETFIYILAMGGDNFNATSNGPGTFGQEDWAGAINGKSLFYYPGAEVAVGRSTFDARDKILDNYLLINDYLPNWYSSAGAIAGGTYSPDLTSVRTGLTNAIWSPATLTNHPVIAAPRTDCTVSCNSARGEGFTGQGWDFPDGSAVVFRYPLGAAQLPVSASNGQVVVDWDQPGGGEAAVDYLVYYKETTEPDSAY